MTPLSWPGPNLRIAYGCALAVLIVGTLVTYYLARAHPERDYLELRMRVRTWWWIVPPLIVALSIGPWAVALLFALASGIALREYLALGGISRRPSLAVVLAYLAIPVQYGLACLGSEPLFAAAIPLSCLALAMAVLFAGSSAGFLPSVGVLASGMILTLFSFSHIARLTTWSDGPGLVAFLLIVTQLNDVSQYVSGKRFGKTPLAPALSPSKTREGMIGGLVTSTLLGAVLGPLLTALTSLTAAAFAFALALAGVAGDLTISAIKRDAGAKDSGTLLPGHGGLLDRMDSLIYAAPLFYYGLSVFHSRL
jgi:phosphatidate cytidylyltransferase